MNPPAKEQGHADTDAALRLALVCEHIDPDAAHDSEAAGLAAALARRGHAVRVIAGASTRPHLPGVELVVYGSRRLRSVSRIWGFHRWAMAQLEAGGYDASVSITTLVPARLVIAGDGTVGGYTQARVRQAGCPVGRVFQMRYMMGPAPRLRAWLERQALASNQVAYVASDNDLVAAQLAACPALDQAKACRLPPAVFAEPIADRQAEYLRGRLRRAMDIQKSATVFAFPSRSITFGGLTTLMLALKAVVDRGHDAVVLIAGPYRYTHLAWIGQLGLRGRVRFVGQTGRLSELIAGADAVVVPAVYDPAGHTVLAGLRQARPVVTTRGCGAAGLVGEAGAVLDDPTDAGALADALADLCNPERRAACAAHAAEAGSLLEPSQRLDAIQALLR